MNGSGKGRAWRWGLAASLFIVAVVAIVWVVLGDKADAPKKNAAAAGLGPVWDNASVYFVLTDRFYNGNPANDHSYGRPSVDATGKNVGTFHGGDLAGLTAKLKEGYFTKLGINAIWITAPYEQIHGFVSGTGGQFAHYGYHGYYALDYTEMDRNMGTVDEMREFVDTAHSMGIRVVMDVVLNHAGFNTLADMEQYGFGKIKGIDANWTPGASQNWDSYQEAIDYKDKTAWAKWWGSWVRAGLPGYAECGTGDKTLCLSGLPDFRTELTESVGMAPVLLTKWGQEGTADEPWLIPAAKGLRADKGLAPADAIIGWLSAWVKEFGVDGFRVDTAKHVDIDRLTQLKEAADGALTEWRKTNTGKPGAEWKDKFWMVGEVWDHGVQRDAYYDNGMDSLINFSFQSYSRDDMEPLYAHYAKTLHGEQPFDVLTYLSSHDTKLYDRTDLIRGGTRLLLMPGGIQVFYGDETARPEGDSGTDATQGTRSDMNWSSIDEQVLAHWQKLGQFRNRHVAVGGGAHQQLAASPYTFSRVYDKDGVSDKVVVVTGASGTVTVDVSSVFPDGTKLRDAYTGNTAKVKSGKAAFSAAPEGVILIEQE
ncbi:alpha-amylase family glycosyl hydrolase [Gorillibacterium massiliense]|uniref:alpha-amylase family glycosyl hydrolase n=1 Tax=Gorillibacterium massiliense TaxID=1280390 RepID=UPI0006936213|nr:alpha-amylase family glycosyl hydrolase [Gorillibacterium massiliense]